MKTGYSKVCINPPYGAPIVGYYQERLTKGILDSIYARAVAFDDGEKKAVVIALDLCILGQKYYDEMKEAVVKATGMDKDAVFITLSHNRTSTLIKCWCPIFSLNTAVFRHLKKYYCHFY